MFCKNCGAKLDDDARFCENCGTVIKNAAPEAPANAPDAAPEAPVNAPSESTNASEEPSAPAPAMVSENEQPKPPEKSKKPKKGLLIGAAAILVLLVVCIVIGVTRGGSSGSGSNIAFETNFNNGGKFAYDDSHLYIVGLYNEDDEDTVVYSTDYNGGNKTVVSDNKNITNIRICDGRIYYETKKETESSTDYAIGVMNTDGSSDTTIVTSASSFDHYDVYNRKLFYLTDSEIHCCTLTGEDDTCILDSVDTFTMCKGFIYYVDDNDVIHSYRIKNESTQELCQASGAKDLSVDKDTLYFACNTGLSSISINGDENITPLISDDALGNYTVYNDCFYYNHELSWDDIEGLAKYLNADSVTIHLYFAGVGQAYKVPISGGTGTALDDFYAYSLYSYPQGMYRHMSYWDHKILPVDADILA